MQAAAPDDLMAGIFAIVDRSGRRPPDQALIDAASAARHRSGARPTVDWRGSFAWVTPDPDVPLACEFSAHKEESESGLVVVMHGRLDNRSHLLNHIGNLPASCSDAELVLSGYRNGGRLFLASLIGNFALLIRDTDGSSFDATKLIALQDPSWMRPLYYAESADTLVFASEIKQIQAWDARYRKIDEEYIARFLTNVDTPLTATAYQGVRLIEPGRMLIQTERGDIQSVVRTDPDAAIMIRSVRRMSFETAVRALRTLLDEVTADVVGRYERIGIFLSGGTDSMGAAALAASHLRDLGIAPGDRLHAYCFDFTGFPDADERHISRQLTDLYGIPVTEIPVRDAMPLSDLRLADIDDPGIGVYQELFEYTCRVAAKDGMTAMLSGNRGDLLFGETVYDLFGPLARGNWKDFYAEMAHLSAHYGTGLWRYMARQAASATTRLIERALPRPFAAIRRFRHRRARLLHQIPDWIEDELRRDDDLSSWLRNDYEQTRWTTLRQRRATMIRSPIQMRGTLSSERTLARHGLAHLDLWSDQRLAEFALSIPQHLVTTPRYPKKLVRAALAPLMPQGSESITQKIYPISVYEATVRSPNRSMSAILTDMTAHEKGFLNEHRLRKAHDAMVRKEADPPAFWRAVALERWLRK